MAAMMSTQGVSVGGAFAEASRVLRSLSVRRERARAEVFSGGWWASMSEDEGVGWLEEVGEKCGEGFVQHSPGLI